MLIPTAKNFWNLDDKPVFKFIAVLKSKLNTIKIVFDSHLHRQGNIPKRGFFKKYFVIVLFSKITIYFKTQVLLKY